VATTQGKQCSACALAVVSATKSLLANELDFGQNHFGQNPGTRPFYSACVFPIRDLVLDSSYGLQVSYVQLRTSGMINKRRAVLYPKDHSTYDKVIALGNIEPSSGPVPARAKDFCAVASCVRGGLSAKRSDQGTPTRLRRGGSSAITVFWQDGAAGRTGDSQAGMRASERSS
jgi:hypothetical protein